LAGVKEKGEGVVVVRRGEKKKNNEKLVNDVDS